ncbi:WD repeat-containing protein 61 [Clavulina sp. PMI_390]|nr:WD repeat-containing protein 61 [Clavulina sp. PMI_390]
MSLQFIHSHDSTKQHTDTIWSTRWLPNDTVVSISSDGTATQWDAKNGEVIKSLQPHPLALTSLSSNASGTQVLINSIEGTNFLWDLESGHAQEKLETFTHKVEGVEATFSVSLSPLADTYASTGSSGMVRIHRTDHENFGQVVEKLSPRTDGRNKFGMFVAYSPDGGRIALSTDQGGVFVFDIQSKSLVHSFPGHATCVRSLAWSADSQLLLSGSDDKRMVLYDTRSASASANSSEGVVASMAGHSSWVLSTDFSLDSRLAASGSSDGTVKIWDIGGRQCVSTLSDNAGEVWGVSWKPVPSAGNGALVSSGEDGKLRFWASAGSQP